MKIVCSICQIEITSHYYTPGIGTHCRLCFNAIERRKKELGYCGDEDSRKFEDGIAFALEAISCTRRTINQSLKSDSAEEDNKYYINSRYSTKMDDDERDWDGPKQYALEQRWLSKNKTEYTVSEKKYHWADGIEEMYKMSREEFVGRGWGRKVKIFEGKSNDVSIHPESDVYFRLKYSMVIWSKPW